MKTREYRADQDPELEFIQLKFSPWNDLSNEQIQDTRITISMKLRRRLLLLA